MKKHIPLDERIIFALDFSTSDEAKYWVSMVESHISFFKVGLQLFLACWFPIVEWIIGRGHKVMVDLKFFDVPETVKLAIKQLKNRGITYATIHGNDPIVRAAAQEKGDLQILAVTVLTSFGENDMREMGLQCPVEDLVYHRAGQAITLGCDGVVSSGMEAARLRAGLGDNFIIVTPGIRLVENTGIDHDDQVRIITPKQAIINGADHVVIGRPIKTAKDPIALIERIQRDIDSVI